MRNALSMATRHRRATVIAALLVLGVAGSVEAQRRGWEHLGTKEIEGRVDNDEIKCHAGNGCRAAAIKMVQPIRVGQDQRADLLLGNRSVVRSTRPDRWFQNVGLHGTSFGRRPTVRRVIHSSRSPRRCERPRPECAQDSTLPPVAESARAVRHSISVDAL